MLLHYYQILFGSHLSGRIVFIAIARRTFQQHRKDVSNFDKQFTSEKTDLTPTDKLFMMNLDQTEFMGFSFLNPEFVQHV